MTEDEPDLKKHSTPFRVLITGDRKWNCTVVAREVVRRLKERHGERLVIVLGDAPGVDRSCAWACELARVKVEAYPALGDESGNAAGPARNQEMIDSGVDLAVAIHRNLKFSKGTRDCVAQCLKAGIPTWLIDDDMVKLRRIKSV